MEEWKRACVKHESGIMVHSHRFLYTLASLQIHGHCVSCIKLTSAVGVTDHGFSTPGDAELPNYCCLSAASSHGSHVLSPWLSTVSQVAWRTRPCYCIEPNFGHRAFICLSSRILKVQDEPMW